jgi:hypothetical protein
MMIAITIVSWIGISNHCALGAVAAMGETNGSCPLHSKPAKHQQKPATTECCKTLRATAMTPAKSFSPAVIDLSFARLVIARPPKIFFAPAILATGPPGKTSLFELTSSLRAHAPPLFA